MTPTIRVLGVPFDAHSSYLRGAALAPARILQAWRSPSANAFTELGVDLDAGSIELGAELDLPEGLRDGAAVERIEELAGVHLEDESVRLLGLGGDHSVTWPLLRAHRRRRDPLTVIQLDAHPDLYDSFEGDRYSHGSPFARICEEGLAGSLIQVGVRTVTDHQRRQAERFGVQQIEARVLGSGTPELELDPGPTYVTFDLDVLEPGLAPGVSHPEPGGLTTRQVLDLIHSIPGPIVGADVVELNPLRDTSDLSAMVAARVARELAGRMLEG